MSGNEVISQKLVLIVELPEISFQGATTSRPQNFIFNLGKEVCVCSTSEPLCSNLCFFIGVVWNRSNWERSPILLFDFLTKQILVTPFYLSLETQKGG